MKHKLPDWFRKRKDFVLRHIYAIALFFLLVSCNHQPLDSFWIEPCNENDIWTRFDYQHKRKQVNLGDSLLPQDLTKYLKTISLAYDFCGYADVYLKVPDTKNEYGKHLLIPAILRSDIDSGAICCFFFSPKWIMINNNNQILYRDSILTSPDNLGPLIKQDFLEYTYRKENISGRPPYIHFRWDSATSRQTIIEVINATNKAYIEAIKEKLFEEGIKADLCTVQKGTLDRILGKNYQLQFLISLDEGTLLSPPPPPPLPPDPSTEDI